jgi:YbgC/YbaW family acyl-CoA thioester hydrolase
MNTDSTQPALPDRRDFRCLDPLRVRWAEVDLQKIVFNGHYLMYFDTAVGAYWRQMAMPYHEAMHLLEGDLYVRKASLEYEASARYDDQLHIGMRLLRLGRSSMTLQACAFKGQRRLVHGEIIYVFADPTTQTSRPIPDALRAWIQAFEAGEPMVNVQCGTWDEVGADAAPLRHAVFVEEQGVPVEIERDAQDLSARHVVARNRLGQAVGAGRLVALDGRVGKIGRMAVLPTVRGASVGRAMLMALVSEARHAGLQSVILHAQSPIVGFYQRQGFEICSEPFEEAGIEHLKMQRSVG